VRGQVRGGALLLAHTVILLCALQRRPCDVIVIFCLHARPGSCLLGLRTAFVSSAGCVMCCSLIWRWSWQAGAHWRQAFRPCGPQHPPHCWAGCWRCCSSRLRLPACQRCPARAAVRRWCLSQVSCPC
jgi:hypothetical protein